MAMTQQNRRIQPRQRRPRTVHQLSPHSNHDRPMDRSRRRRRLTECSNQRRRFRSGMTQWAFLLLLLLFDWWNNFKFHTIVHMIPTIPSVVSSSSSSSSSVSFVIPTGRRGRRRHTTTTTITNHHVRIESSSYILRMATMNGRCDTSTTASQVRLWSTIPIFPLRKTVKLPGDNITLNLYEPRYRRMVEEAILCDATADRGEQHAADHPSLPLFGAIYTTNLPHIVVPTSSSNQGTNDDDNSDDDDDDTTYIVPILEPNMVGSLFIVTNHTKTGQQLQPQTVIRLNATAILRFRIIEIIHTGGYDHLVQRDVDAHCTNGTVSQPPPHVVGPTKHTNNTPYIVAKVQLWWSDFDTLTGDAVHDRNGHQRPMNDDNAPCRSSDDDDTAAALLLPHYLGNIITQYGTIMLTSHFGALSADVASWKTAWIRELLYFYNVSSSTFDNDKRVPLYLEQRERLRILSAEMTKMK